MQTHRGEAAKPEPSDDELLFWEHAQPLLDSPGVTRSTMMGLPCLRINGAFFASYDRAGGALLVKLPERDVDALIAADDARPFAPSGRRFREWAAVPPGYSEAWAGLLDRALAYVSALPLTSVSPRTKRPAR